MAASSNDLKLPPGVEIKAPVSAEFAQILTPEALTLVAKLHRQAPRRRRAPGFPAADEGGARR